MFEGIVLAATLLRDVQGGAAARGDLELSARVTARELTFDIVPNVVITTWPNRYEKPAERTNLPERVEPHVTYRDIGMRLEVISILPDIEEILDDALGVGDTSAAKNQNTEKNK